jgi:uncharacterized protein DUF4349
MSGSEFEEYGALVSELRSTAPAAPEGLRQRVLELAPSRSRRRMSSRRRLALVVVPVAVAMAVGAAVVYGVVSPGRNPQARADSAGLAAGVGGTIPGTPQTLGPLHGTAQSPSYAPPRPERKLKAAEAVTGSQTYSIGQTAVNRNPDTVTIPRDRLVHADATLEVQVPNRSALSQATNKASQIVGSLGGYAQSVQYQSSHHGYGSAVLALRVPVQKAQVAIAKLGNLGKLLSQQVSTQDLQQQLTQQTNGIGSLRRAIAVYQQALQNPSLSASERVAIQIKLENARHAVTVLRKARGRTVASGATADISLTLATKSHAVVVTPHDRGRLGRMFHSAVGFLALEAMIVLYALVVLGPVLLLGGLGWWLLRERRRRDERRLLASA